jgi:hypothetical protein
MIDLIPPALLVRADKVTERRSPLSGPGRRVAAGFVLVDHRIIADPRLQAAQAQATAVLGATQT